MKNRLTLEYVLRLPSFCVAPDGTILWPYRMDCGCEMQKVVGSEKGDTKNTTFVFMLVKACKNHIQKTQEIEGFEPTMDRHMVIDNEYYLILGTDEL